MRFWNQVNKFNFADLDFSGYLVDSIAKSQDVGCQIYMAPERLSGNFKYIK
jgi:hypothetical protein